MHQPNTKQLRLGAESERKRHLRFWQRNDWYKERMVWGRQRSLLVLDSGELLIAGIPYNGNKKLSFRNQRAVE